jgi:hypothetical protein
MPTATARRHPPTDAPRRDQTSWQEAPSTAPTPVAVTAPTHAPAAAPTPAYRGDVYGLMILLGGAIILGLLHVIDTVYWWLHR